MAAPAADGEKKDGKLKDSKENGLAVNPRAVAAKPGGKIDCEKLIDQFGCCQRLDQSLIERVHRLTGGHWQVFLRRDFDEILNAYERGDKFYLYTGRGPSCFTKYLQDASKVPLVVQLTDDGKCMWKNLSVEESHRLARENAKDIIACGFDITKTFFFSDFDCVGGGTLLVNGFMQGETGKMSASDPNSAIYVTDSAKVIKTEVDTLVKYLSFYLEDDDELEHIKKEHAAGHMLTGEVKKRLAEVITKLVQRHGAAHAAVTNEGCFIVAILDGGFLVY